MEVPNGAQDPALDEIPAPKWTFSKVVFWLGACSVLLHTGVHKICGLTEAQRPSYHLISSSVDVAPGQTIIRTQVPPTNAGIRKTQPTPHPGPILTNVIIDQDVKRIKGGCSLCCGLKNGYVTCAIGKTQEGPGISLKPGQSTGTAGEDVITGRNPSNSATIHSNGGSGCAGRSPRTDNPSHAILLGELDRSRRPSQTTAADETPRSRRASYETTRPARVGSSNPGRARSDSQASRARSRRPSQGTGAARVSSASTADPPPVPSIPGVNIAR